jgi:hypothetical protein
VVGNYATKSCRGVGNYMRVGGSARAVTRDERPSSGSLPMGWVDAANCGLALLCLYASLLGRVQV